jgi:hypothetical protein
MRLYGEVGHVDYPHNPGALFDCEQCESTCYCVPGETQCVHCSIESERKLNQRMVNYVDRFTY